MKVSLITQQGEHSYIYALYNSLRSCVGTCDLYELNMQQLENLKLFFESHIRLEHVDRLLFFIDPVYIYNQIRFISTLPNVVLLEQNATYTPALFNTISKIYKNMPWMRLIVSGYRCNQRFREDGIDSYFVQSTYDANRFNAKSNYSSIMHTYVYDPGRIINNCINDERIAANLIKIDKNYFRSEQPFARGDVLLYLAEEPQYKYSQHIIEAMACGAVVVAHNLEVEENQYNSLRSSENICLFNDYLSISQVLQYLYGNAAKRKSLSQEAIETAITFFSTENVGKLLGEVVVEPMRDPQGYRQKLKIFGFRF